MPHPEEIAESRSDPVRSRYEFKYFVDEQTLHKFRLYISPFVQPDPYARGRPNLRYPVSSLYLDTPDLALYRATLTGHKSRFKLRLRTYDTNGSAPVYVEIKKRIDDVIIKTRVPIPREDANALIRRSNVHNRTLVGLETSGIAEFVHAATVLDARPAVMVRYFREAYEGSSWPPLRITFDLAIAYRIAIGGRHLEDGGQWQTVPVEGAVVEIKFTDAFPSWLAPLIADLDMQRQPIPKYGMAVGDALSRRGYAPTAVHDEARASLARAPRY